MKKFFYIFAIIIFLTSCAIKRFPKVPFFKRVPEVKNIEYEIKNGNLILSWKRLPEEKNIRSYNLYEAKAPEGIKYNFKSEKNYILIKRINVSELEEGAGKISLTIKNLHNTYKYCFAVRVENVKGKEGDFSNRACVDWYFVKDMITNVKVFPDDHMLKFEWKIKKYPQVKYNGVNIYQKVKNEFVVVASNVPGTKYEIRGLENKRKYEFLFAPVYTYYKTQLEGGYVKVYGIPQDLTPPKLPQFFTGIYTNGGILLKWTRSESPDILGYDIERKMEGEPRYTRINKSIIKEEKYFDANVIKGKVYYYRIRCIDKNFNVSKFSKPIKVLAE